MKKTKELEIDQNLVEDGELLIMKQQSNNNERKEDFAENNSQSSIGLNSKINADYIRTCKKYAESTKASSFYNFIKNSFIIKFFLLSIGFSIFSIISHLFFDQMKLSISNNSDIQNFKFYMFRLMIRSQVAKLYPNVPYNQELIYNEAKNFNEIFYKVLNPPINELSSRKIDFFLNKNQKKKISLISALTYFSGDGFNNSYVEKIEKIDNVLRNGLNLYYNLYEISKVIKIINEIIFKFKIYFYLIGSIIIISSSLLIFGIFVSLFQFYKHLNKIFKLFLTVSIDNYASFHQDLILKNNLFHTENLADQVFNNIVNKNDNLEKKNINVKKKKVVRHKISPILYPFFKMLTWMITFVGIIIIFLYIDIEKIGIVKNSLITDINAVNYMFDLGILNYLIMVKTVDFKKNLNYYNYTNKEILDEAKKNKKLVLGSLNILSGQNNFENNITESICSGNLFNNESDTKKCNNIFDGTLQKGIHNYFIFFFNYFINNLN